MHSCCCALLLLRERMARNKSVSAAAARGQKKKSGAATMRGAGGGQLRARRAPYNHGSMQGSSPHPSWLPISPYSSRRGRRSRCRSTQPTPKAGDATTPTTTPVREGGAQKIRDKPKWIGETARLPFSLSLPLSLSSSLQLRFCLLSSLLCSTLAAVGQKTRL